MSEVSEVMKTAISLTAAENPDPKPRFSGIFEENWLNSRRIQV
jgi:hypothetical protein